MQGKQSQYMKRAYQLDAEVKGGPEQTNSKRKYSFRVSESKILIKFM